ncbi:tyrosine-type recombinase/integrase [Martelella sp. AMO21009]
MADSKPKPKAATIASLAPGKKLHDGRGLYVFSSKSGTKSFVFRYTFDGKSREDGLGAFKATKGPGPGLTLKEAREAAEEWRVLIRQGRDPRVEIKGKRAKGETEEEAQKTFADAMQAVLANKEKRWRNDKHRAQWHMTLNRYAKPLHALSVADIRTSDVKAVLLPHWHERPETADRLRMRIEAVLDYAIAEGWRRERNPATSRLLNGVMPSRSEEEGKVNHFAAMAFSDVPTFYAKLAASNSTGAKALMFTILSAARSGETRNAVWNEVDFDVDVWAVPAVRYKTKKEHRVPLSEQAVELLTGLYGEGSDGLIFKGTKADKPLSDMTLSAFLRRGKYKDKEGRALTVHGFRSAFRDWAAESGVSFDVAEMCLGHEIGNKTSRAYYRTDLIDERRTVMQNWANFVTKLAGD